MFGYKIGGLNMTEKGSYYTLKGYSLISNANISYSMEDYLEMIYRLFLENEIIRVSKLSECLNVKPSSASKMVNNLKNKGLVDFEKYGVVTLSKEGIELGKYLIFRHDTINELLCYINKTQNEVEQTEKIEHFINAETVYNMRQLLHNLRHK